MRQDTSFQPGEAVTSATYAALLSAAFNWLVTLDPHLHRYANLNRIYSIPTAVATAAKPIADWLCCNIDRPVIIGPDEESRQWVERIAFLAKAKSTVLRKTRSGDFSVSIDGSDLGGFEGRTPVIVDDIASSARTLIEAVRVVCASGHKEPTCIVVHPIFAGDAWHQLHEAGAGQIVSTNAIVHETNRIDISAPLTEAIAKVAAFGE
jgi:ribose-phosphate pyrophosphokinase